MRPNGFWSYARDDDKDLGKALSNLRMRIERRIRLLLGDNIGVFQDVVDIRTGDDWEKVLRGQLDGASFLIPVITPRFLNSTWCKQEVLAFCQAADEDGFDPLIFPLYYIRDRRFESDAEDVLVKTLRKFQYFDFRELQFETEERLVEREVHKLAEAIESRLYKIKGDITEAGESGVTHLGAGQERLEGAWQEGDKEPSKIRFVGYSTPSNFNVGVFEEGDVYEVAEFDGRGEAPFRVVDKAGGLYWVNKDGFRVVE